jgi:hypothetical protein
MATQHKQHHHQPPPEMHSASSHTEVAAAALGSVYAANELGKALDDHDKNQGEHILKAGVAAIVAIGAFEMLRRKMNEPNGHPTSTKAHPTSDEPRHHKRHLVEEAAGAYALGKELLGDHRHHFAHMVAEAVGATGLIKEVFDRVGST